MNAIFRNLKTHRQPILPVLGFVLLLAACSADEKPKLDGERISVLNFERALAVDPRVSEQAVTCRRFQKQRLAQSRRLCQPCRLSPCA